MRNFGAVALLAICSIQAWALPDATLAARASVGAMQELLASPPLPGLEAGSGGVAITPQVGTATIKTEGSKYFAATTFPPASAYTQDHVGKISGLSAALGITGASRGRLGWFGFVVGSDLKGSLHASNAGSPTFSLESIRARALAGVAGLNYRFWGESKSPFAMGAFLGPAYMNVKSDFTLVQHDIAAPDQKLSMNPAIPAAYSGLQFKVRLRQFLINPYVLYMKELSSKCKLVEAAGGGSPCVDLDTSFLGYGLYLGYGGFRVRVYSAVRPAGEQDDLELSSYSVSYTFGI